MNPNDPAIGNLIAVCVFFYCPALCIGLVWLLHLVFSKDYK